MSTARMYRSNGDGIAKTGRPRKKAARNEVKTVNLALQGGGTHGAFVWGVLDRLLEDERLTFEGISACSAGAMNAVVLAYGLTEGGREGAKKALADFWRRISHSALMSPLQPTLLDRLTHSHLMENSPAFVAFDLITRLLSPYQLNPANYNPLRSIFEQTVNFDRLREDCATKLFLSATNVYTGKIKVFENRELSADAVLASACLPSLFQAVEIDSELYWDGGYMGNPALFPLIYNCDSPDIVILHVNPITRCEEPRTAQEILTRINEISFNSSLIREMRAIAFVTKLIDEGQVKPGALKRMLIHAIEADGLMCKLSASSKFNADWEFLTNLRDIGRESASRWLSEHFDNLNVESSIDVRTKYL